MSLRQQQMAISEALWGNHGQNALNSTQQWKAFLKHRDNWSLAQISRERLALYEDLLKNTVSETLTTLFPLCKTLLGKQWPQLIEHYRRAYPNPSYRLYECGQQFPDFLTSQQELCTQFPFLTELALFEWMEVALENEPPNVLPPAFQNSLPDNLESLSQASPVWNPTLQLTAWQYPIVALLEHHNPEEGLPLDWQQILYSSNEVGSPHLLFMYRDTETHRARFFRINGLMAQLFQLSMTEGITSYREQLQHLKALNASLTHHSLETVLELGLQLFQRCYEQNILLGSVPQEKAVTL